MSWLDRFFRRAPLPPPPREVAPYRLEDALKTGFAPTMRSVGFKGSGRNFWRTENGLVQTVNIQGSRWGGSFAVNLGLHPLDFPSALMEIKEPKALREYDCMLRRRLSPSGTDHWWPHDSLESAQAAVADAARIYLNVGEPIFARQSSEDAPIWRITPEAFQAGKTGWDGFHQMPRLACDLARLRMKSGDLDAARGFASLTEARFFTDAERQALL